MGSEMSCCQAEAEGDATRKRSYLARGLPGKGERTSLLTDLHQEEMSSSSPLGLRWKLDNTIKLDGMLKGGRELSNPKLATALTLQCEFTPEQWSSFGIHDLHENDYIRCGNYYFTPTTACSTGMHLQVLKLRHPSYSAKTRRASILAHSSSKEMPQPSSKLPQSNFETRTPQPAPSPSSSGSQTSCEQGASHETGGWSEALESLEKEKKVSKLRGA